MSVFGWLSLNVARSSSNADTVLIAAAEVNHGAPHRRNPDSPPKIAWTSGVPAMVGRGEVRRTLAGLKAAKSDETATVGQGGCCRWIRAQPPCLRCGIPSGLTPRCWVFKGGSVSDTPFVVDGLIDGRAAARQVRCEVAVEVQQLRAVGIHPHVVFLRVGDDPASETYVNAKARAAGWVGIRSQHRHLPEDTTADELEAQVRDLNGDPDVDGILVQLPLPASIGSLDVLNVVDPLKDVDGFHLTNLGALLGGTGALQPCTPSGIMRLIAMMGIDLQGLHAVVVGRSLIVGRPMNALFTRAAATTTCCHRHTQELARHTSKADVLVVATGVPGLITADHVKEGAYVFDVGMNRLSDGTLVGDVVFDEVRGKARGLTPVPGGVGPMTIAQLLENTVAAARLHRGLAVHQVRRA
jgi:methylenetetrahydrofolate dehydrogenase (NADP+)/methenyltetrahydrofolate cyclohydrolase